MSGSDLAPSPLSDADAQVLYEYGRDMLQDAVGMIWETIFMSAYGVFFALAVYTIFRKGFRRRSSIAMLCVVVYLYTSSLTLWALNVTNWFKSTRIFFMDNSNTPLPDRVAAGNAFIATLGTPMEALFMFNMVVGDTVVIWRAWVLYQRTLWVVAIPCVMLLMSFIFTVIDLTCLTGAGWSMHSSLASGGAVCAHAELISWAFSFVTNATCTILISYKAWHHRQLMKSLNMTKNTLRISTNKLLSILVESGFIYCLFWLTQLILFFDVSRESPAAYVYELFASMGDQISGIYPTLIVVIVNLHQTIWEPSSENGNANDTVSTVQWAAGGKRSGPGPGTDAPLGQRRTANIRLGSVAHVAESV
ncbi:hypothetical protein DFH06DRAFT_138137 [Mycena polygramma]|nr:hypothetical protein DFH06DRAFT_138137 [Mycena polygramma]